MFIQHFTKPLMVDDRKNSIRISRNMVMYARRNFSQHKRISSKVVLPIASSVIYSKSKTGM